jgi:hypothetical protein
MEIHIDTHIKLYRFDEAVFLGFSIDTLHLLKTSSQGLRFYWVV